MSTIRERFAKIQNGEAKDLSSESLPIENDMASMLKELVKECFGDKVSKAIDYMEPDNFIKIVESKDIDSIGLAHIFVKLLYLSPIVPIVRKNEHNEIALDYEGRCDSVVLSFMKSEDRLYFDLSLIHI